MTHRLLTAFAALCTLALPFTARAEESKDRLEIFRGAPGERLNKCTPDRWICVIGGNKETSVMIHHDSIAAISMQTYMLEGSQKIREVTIDTKGNNTIRFYCLCSTLTKDLLERGSSIRERVDHHTDNGTRYPAKKYPEATHSHNVEYQISTPDQIGLIYESACHSWVKKLPIILTVKG